MRRKQKMRVTTTICSCAAIRARDLSEMLQWVINRDPKQKKIVKSSRIEPKDVPAGNTTNGITAISKAVMRLKNLQQLFIANAPIEAGDVFTDWQGENTAYREQWAEESKNWKWGDLTDLTDIELYNNPNFTELPAFLGSCPNCRCSTWRATRESPTWAGSGAVSSWATTRPRRPWPPSFR